MKFYATQIQIQSSDLLLSGGFLCSLLIIVDN